MKPSLLLLSILLLSTSVALASPIGFLFQTDPSRIQYDRDGNGTEESYVDISSTLLKVWLEDPFRTAIVSAPDELRYYPGYEVSATIDGMYLDPIKLPLQCSSCYVYNSIGFDFYEGIGLDMRGTRYTSDQRIDQTAYFSWSGPYSNDVVDSLEAVSVPYPPYNGYTATLDLYKTLANFAKDNRQFYFGFTTVWSDKNTYMYQKHATWSGYGHIVAALDGSVPEPATALLIAPALLLGFAVRKRRKNG